MTFAAGASASIIKTLNEIEAILEGEKLTKSGPKRAELRKKLQEALIKSSRSWYRKGFNRGHKESYLAFKTDDQVPTILAVQVEREFLPNTKSSIKLKSTLSQSVS